MTPEQIAAIQVAKGTSALLIDCYQRGLAACERHGNAEGAAWYLGELAKMQATPMPPDPRDEALRLATETLTNVAAWLSDKKLNTFTYMESTDFYADKDQHVGEVKAALAKIKEIGT